MNKFALSATALAIGLAFSGPTIASFEQNGSPKYVFQVQYAAFAKPTKQALRELIPNVFEVYIHKDSKLPESMSWHAGQDWVSIAKQLTWSGELQLRIDWQELAVYIRPANLSFADSLQPTSPAATDTQGQLTLEAKVTVSGEPEIIETASANFEIPEQPAQSEPTPSVDPRSSDNPEVILRDTVSAVDGNSIEATVEVAKAPEPVQETQQAITVEPEALEEQPETVVPVSTELSDFEMQVIAQYEAAVEANRLAQEIEVAKQIADELATEIAQSSVQSEATEPQVVEPEVLAVIEAGNSEVIQDEITLNTAKETLVEDTTIVDTPVVDALVEVEIILNEEAKAEDKPENQLASENSIEPKTSAMTDEAIVNTEIVNSPEVQPVQAPIENPIASFFGKLFGPKASAQQPAQAPETVLEPAQEVESSEELVETAENVQAPLAAEQALASPTENLEPEETNTALETSAEMPVVKQTTPVEIAEAFNTSQAGELIPQETSEVNQEAIYGVEESSKIVFVFEENTNLRAALTDLVKQEGWNLVWKAPESKNVISNYFVSYEAADLKSLLKIVLPNFGLKAERYVPNKVIVIK